MLVLVLCSVSVIGDPVEELKDRIDSAATIGEAESYKGAVRQLPDASDRERLLERIDARQNVLRYGTPEIGSLLSNRVMLAGAGSVAVVIIVFAFILLARRKRDEKDETEHDVEVVIKNLDKVGRFEHVIGSILDEKRRLYGRAIHLLSRAVMKDEEDVSREVERKYDMIMEVEKRTRPLEEREFWIFSHKVNHTQMKLRLESFSDEIRKMGLDVAEVFHDMDSISSFLRDHKLNPSPHNVKEAIRGMVGSASRGKDVEELTSDSGVFGKISSLRSRQKRELEQFSKLEHHELVLLNRYHHNLKLEEKNLTELADRLGHQDAQIMKRVEIDDEHIESRVKELVSKMVLLQRKLDVYNNLLEGEKAMISAAKALPRLFARSVVEGRKETSSKMVRECSALIDQLKRDMQREENLFFVLTGAVPGRDLRSPKPEAGLLGEIHELLNEIEQREVDVSNEKKRIRKVQRSRKVRFEGSVLVGTLEMVGGYSATAVKRFGGSKGMGRDIYLTRNAMITADPSHNKGGYIYANVATNEAEVPIAVHRKFDPPMYTWRGETMKQGEVYTFGDLRFIFRLKSLKKSQLDDFRWSKVLVSKDR